MNVLSQLVGQIVVSLVVSPSNISLVVNVLSPTPTNTYRIFSELINQAPTSNISLTITGSNTDPGMFGHALQNLNYVVGIPLAEHLNESSNNNNEPIVLSQISIVNGQPTLDIEITLALNVSKLLGNITVAGTTPQLLVAIAQDQQPFSAFSEIWLRPISFNTTSNSISIVISFNVTDIQSLLDVVVLTADACCGPVDLMIAPQSDPTQEFDNIITTILKSGTPFILSPNPTKIPDWTPKSSNPINDLDFNNLVTTPEVFNMSIGFKIPLLPFWVDVGDVTLGVSYQDQQFATVQLIGLTLGNETTTTENVINTTPAPPQQEIFIQMTLLNQNTANGKALENLLTAILMDKDPNTQIVFTGTINPTSSTTSNGKQRKKE